MPFESVQRLTQHWAQHTQCEVLHTHAQTSGNQLQCQKLVPFSSAAVWNQRISWDRKSKWTLLITEEFKFDLISQFHVPLRWWERSQDGNHMNHVTTSWFNISAMDSKKYVTAHQKYTLPLIGSWIRKEEGNDKVMLFKGYRDREFHYRITICL